MCGFAVILRSDPGAVEGGELRRMLSTLQHRGPDGAGFVLLEDAALGLGHVRLSVIDLDGGAQPMQGTGDTWVVSNGEVYDYRRLREDLRRWGYPFRTGSDTEVILAAYARYGDECVEHLNGELAFVLWDGRQRRLLAARDAGGVKPLFFRHHDGELLLASEAKALLSLPHVPRAISRDYLTSAFMGVYGPDVCAFDGISSLGPGELLTCELGAAPRRRRWWSARYPTERSMTLGDARALLRSELEEAVARRCVADVPVHVYLSGGIDSTVVCGLMARRQPRLTAYHISFDDEQLDEAPVATRIAAHLDVDLRTVRCSAESLAADFERAVTHTELAIGNPNSMAKLALSRLVRDDGRKVCLTGDGADEVLGGYPYFKMERLWRMHDEGGDARKQARALWRRFQRLEVSSLGVSWSRRLAWRRAPRPFGAPLFAELRTRQLKSAHRWLLDAERLGLDDEHDPIRTFERSYDASVIGRLHPFHASREIAFLAMTGYLIPNLGDRVEMAHGVECRLPFLDRRLMEAVNTIPPEHMMDIANLREKRLLHEAFDDVRPPFMREIHKHTFLAPGWRELSATPTGRALFAELLSRRALEHAGVFRPATLRSLRHVWRIAPRRSLLKKQLDIVMGSALSVQLLWQRFVARPVESDAGFAARELSPTTTSTLASTPLQPALRVAT